MRCSIANHYLSIIYACLGACVMFITKTLKGINSQVTVGGVFSWDIRMVRRVE